MLYDLVQETPKEIGVLGFLPQEGGQEHLFFQATFCCNGHDEWQKVESNGLFAGLEHAGQSEQNVLLLRRKRQPITAVLTEVNLAWIPDAVSFGFFEEGVMLARELRKELDELQGKVEILLNSLEVRENDEAEVPNITKFDFQSSESQNDSQDKQAP